MHSQHHSLATATLYTHYGNPTDSVLVTANNYSVMLLNTVTVTVRVHEMSDISEICAMTYKHTGWHAELISAATTVTHALRDQCPRNIGTEFSLKVKGHDKRDQRAVQTSSRVITNKVKRRLLRSKVSD